MKVIDLLNKIANGEEVPKKIIFKGTIFYYKDNVYNSDLHYYSSDKFGWLVSTDIKLNDEIEIIEEPMKIEKASILTMSKGLMNLTENERLLLRYINKNSNKINEIIDYINENK